MCQCPEANSQGPLEIYQVLRKSQDVCLVARLQQQHEKDRGETQILSQASNKKWPELLVTAPLPEWPWNRIAADLCELEGKNYLIVVDYYSHYTEMAHLPSTSSLQDINHLKSIFGRWGIPLEPISDNGMQFASAEFRDFSEKYGFVHTASSPQYPRRMGPSKDQSRLLNVFLSSQTHTWLPGHTDHGNRGQSGSIDDGMADPYHHPHTGKEASYTHQSQSGADKRLQS